MLKLAVVGSRGFKDYECLKNTLDSIHNKIPITEIISGGAKGADSLAEKWAIENEVPTTIIYPEWELYGKSAGFIRNREIISLCDRVVAFWDGESKGTQHSFKLAKEQNKKILKIMYNANN